ncbi:MAG TPA: non-heme iron oxygenase ferredoxin subunit [Acidimicrobiales bacterium]|nr:non-heme iron oxygenase ferredoxin subunit [Acidimicrobiales bacterium]
MNDAAPQLVRLCAVKDVAVGAARRFEVGGVGICVVRCEDGFHAVSDTCSHEDYSLAAGEVDAVAAEIECWKHGSLFSLVTGEPQTLPATLPIDVFEIVVEAGDVWVVWP